MKQNQVKWQVWLAVRAVYGLQTTPRLVHLPELWWILPIPVKNQRARLAHITPDKRSDEQVATGILTVDLMGPFPASYPKRFRYALVGAFRGKLADTGAPAPLFPVSIPLKPKEGKTVAEAIRTSILFIESVHTGMYAEGKRVHTILSDKGSEFENKDVVDVLADMAVYQTFLWRNRSECENSKTSHETTTRVRIPEGNMVVTRPQIYNSTFAMQDPIESLGNARIGRVCCSQDSFR
eukprot:668313-Amphidinium_carterae.2